MAKAKILPIPSFYDPDNAEKWGFRPNEKVLFEEAAKWRKAHNIAPAAGDKTNIVLMIIDGQKDFCYPEGTLYVGGRSGRGAIEDNDRTAQFIYKNLARLSDIYTTLDTHFIGQIFFPGFFVDANGDPVGANTTITTAELKEGKYRPNEAYAAWLCNGNYAWLLKQVIHYTEELERAGKYQLYIWPFHCLLGSEGHALAGVLQEARFFHAAARFVQTWAEVKGGNPLTENYSVFRPEVLSKWDGLPLTQKNAKFIEKLTRADYMIIAGQAASHCVKSSIEDLLAEILATDAELAKKVYILRDCTSAVVIPGIVDFTDAAEAAFDKFAAAGMNLVNSIDPIENWPGMSL